MELYNSNSLLAIEKDESNERKLSFSADSVGSSLVGRFESIALERPDMTAVSMEGEALSFGALNAKAERFAAWLDSFGFGTEAAVVLCVDKSLELVVALMGVLKSSACFVPVDPDLPRERIAAIVGRSKARLVITEERLVDSLKKGDVLVYDLGEAMREANQRAQVGAGRRVAAPDSLAYIIFTSGSTGEPKGVAISRDSFFHYISWAVCYYRFSHEGTSIVHTSLSFDLTLTSIFVPLVTGIEMRLLPSGKEFSALLANLEDGSTHISFLKLTPTHLSLLEEHFGGRETDWLIDVLIVGGEKLKNRNVLFWESASSETRIYNEYGPTEATVGCCVCRVEGKDCDPGDSLPIGVAIDKVRLSHGDSSIEGDEGAVDKGQLRISGPCLARGYLYEPALTAASFVPDESGDGTRLYLTGDQVSYDIERNRYVYHDRSDRQVKIDGYRIELGEVEVALKSLGGVEDAVALLVPDKKGRDALACFLRLRSPNSDVLDVSVLENGLKGRLHRAAIPRYFYLIDSLPAQLSGKVDYGKLRRERHNYDTLRRAFLPPRTPLEELIASLWRSILGLDEVGIDDSFFALNGNSMKSIQFVYEAKKHGLVFSTRDLFEYQTIRELVALLQSSSRSGVPSPEPKPYKAFEQLSPGDREKMPAHVVDAYPLSYLQAGTLLESSSHEGSGTYHNVNSYYVSCILDTICFEKSLEIASERHPILRTFYDFVSYSEPLQLVCERVEVPLEVINISDKTEREQNQAVETFIEIESRRSFDWTKAPLLKFILHIRGPNRMQITLSKHHSILDGWSAASLISEIVKNYFSLVQNGNALYRGSLATRFGDYVQLEKSAISSPEFGDFWREELRDLPRNRFRKWGQGEANPDFKHSSISSHMATISLETSDGLKALASKAKVPLKNVLLGAHLRVVSQMTGSLEVVTGLVTHGRPEIEDSDKTVGLFLNTIPFRRRLNFGQAWLGLSQSLFQQEFRLHPYQRYPMALMKRDLGRERLFDSIFYFTNFHVFRDFRSSADLKVLGSSVFEETETPFTAAFSVHPLTSEISLKLHFKLDCFSAEQIQRTRAYFERILLEMAATPSSYVMGETLLGEKERLFLMENGRTGSCATSYQASSIYSLLKRNTDLRGDSVALVLDGRNYSYAFLRHEVDRLAAVLHDSGVGVESKVGIWAESPRTVIVSMFAINRVGGAFVVLDSDWPETRLRQVVDELETVAIIVDGSIEISKTFGGISLIDIGASWSARPNTNFLEDVDGEALAYVIYTSGSSGRPKGVMVKRKGIYQSTVSRMAYYGTRSERFLLLSPFGFDSALAGILGTLCSGGTLIVPSPDERRDVGRILSKMGEDRVTRLLAIPSLYRLLLSHVENSSCDSVEEVIVAGEELSRSIAETHFRKLPHAQLFNEYGPTEGSVWATVSKVLDRTTLETEAPISIGRPIQGCEVQIVNESADFVSSGVFGELCIAGDGLARGYLNSPRETALRFVPNGIESKTTDGRRVYRTGDLACFDPSGDLLFGGRIDNQVKVRGFRIELEEIEESLRSCFPDRDFAVNVESEVGDSARIVAYVATPGGVLSAGIRIERMRDRMREMLPSYMWPSEFRGVVELPKLYNGKIDRKALSGIGSKSIELGSMPIKKANSEIEKTLGGLWSDVLGIADMCVERDFFEQGGDSLLANQVILKTSKIFSVKVSLREFFDEPTIRGQESVIRERCMAKGIDATRLATLWNSIT